VRSHALDHRIETWGYRIDEVVAPRKVSYEKAVASGLEHADFRSLQLGLDARTRDGRVVANSEVTTEGRAGFSMAYLSDTAFAPELADFVRDVEFLYHESTYLDRHLELAKKTGHSTAGQAASLARLAGAKRLLLGHFSQRYARLTDFSSEASAKLDIPVVLSCSGMTVIPSFVEQ
jgi:ribonuclease Z